MRRFGADCDCSGTRAKPARRQHCGAGDTAGRFGCARSRSSRGLATLFTAIQQLAAQRRLLAYHDRSDGGLWAAICEMAFAGHVGVSLNVDLLTLEHGHESDYGDAKNWARQVVGRREERTLRG